MAAGQESSTQSVSNGVTVTLFGPVGGPGAERVYAAVNGTKTFRVDLLMSIDAGATFTVYKSLTGAACLDATYVFSTEVDQFIPRLFRIDLKNTDVAPGTFQFSGRAYNAVQH